MLGVGQEEHDTSWKKGILYTIFNVGVFKSLKYIAQNIYMRMSSTDLALTSNLGTISTIVKHCMDMLIKRNIRRDVLL